jgi:Ser/Thr protein kinase RdoA (MazF antagonist)
MGVITKITLKQVNALFKNYNFTKLTPTSSGIIDTTYIVSTDKKSYILKKYERDIKSQILNDAKLLHELKSFGLNVSTLLESSKQWYLYEKLKGIEPKNIGTHHIQAMARFLAKLHLYLSKNSCKSNNKKVFEVTKELAYTKRNFYLYYKKSEFLKYFSIKNKVFIHGDIFKDNTVFHSHKVGIFDSIDGSCGTFIFDCAVMLIGFGIKSTNKYFINLFLNTYNQNAPLKLSYEKLLQEMKIASHFYAIKRIYTYKNTKKAKDLL